MTRPFLPVLMIVVVPVDWSIGAWKAIVYRLSVKVDVTVVTLPATSAARTVTEYESVDGKFAYGKALFHAAPVPTPVYTGLELVNAGVAAVQSQYMPVLTRRMATPSLASPEGGEPASPADPQVSPVGVPQPASHVASL